MAVKVTVASGLKTTVEVPCVNVPSLVKSVPEVPLIVMVEELAVKVPPFKAITPPMVTAWAAAAESAVVNMPLVRVKLPAAAIVVAVVFGLKVSWFESVSVEFMVRWP